jgi:hypothetical protein
VHEFSFTRAIIEGEKALSTRNVARNEARSSYHPAGNDFCVVLRNLRNTTSQTRSLSVVALLRKVTYILEPERPRCKDRHGGVRFFGPIGGVAGLYCHGVFMHAHWTKKISIDIWHECTGPRTSIEGPAVDLLEPISAAVEAVFEQNDRYAKNLIIDEVQANRNGNSILSRAISRFKFPLSFAAIGGIVHRSLGDENNSSTAYPFRELV